MLVRELEALLLTRFPKERAEEWDMPGMLVGDPVAAVSGVACALDPTPEAVRAAAAAQANVLVTHHPTFLSAPTLMTPQAQTSSQAGAAVYEAARLGVSLIAMHTNLDRSDEALDLQAQLLGLTRTGRLEEPDGYGALLDARGLTLGQLAARAAKAYGCTPTVWGDDSRGLETIAVCSGSLGSLGDVARSRDVSCVVAGEAGYHRLLELYLAGVAAILVGHDASERPYARLLASVIATEAPDTRITILDEPLRWHAWENGSE